MYNSNNVISICQIINYFLPKIAREYNVIEEAKECQFNSRDWVNKENPQVSSPLISAGWFTTLFSNNNLRVQFQEDRSKKGEEKEKTSTNFLQLIIMASIPAISTAFGLGKLRSSITAAEENIFYSRDVIVNSPNWNTGLPPHITANILNVANKYCSVETDRKEKLYNYQYSLMGIATGILITTTVQLLSVGVLTAATAELIAIAGVITAVASAAFGAYQVAIHWDDFAKAREEFKSLHLAELLPPPTELRCPPPSPPPPGWRPFGY